VTFRQPVLDRGGQQVYCIPVGGYKVRTHGQFVVNLLELQTIYQESRQKTRGSLLIIQKLQLVESFLAVLSASLGEAKSPTDS